VLLAAGTQLQRLDITGCQVVSDLTPLGALVDLVDLHTLNMRDCHSVSDLAPFGALVNLQSLDMYGCSSVSDLAPLTAMVNLRSLNVRWHTDFRVPKLGTRLPFFCFFFSISVRWLLFRMCGCPGIGRASQGRQGLCL
jgi:hypothetical protein